MQRLSLMSALFSKIQQQLLILLYCKPDQSLHTNEIIRLTAMGRGVVQRELERFVNAGLVIVKKSGNQKQYQANTSCPIFYELRAIVLKTAGLSELLREALQPVADKIKIAFIFGSTASFNDSNESDVDLMLIAHELSYADIFQELQVVEQKLGRTINPTIYSMPEWVKKRKQSNHFITQVLSKKKIFLIGSEDELGSTN